MGDYSSSVTRCSDLDLMHALIGRGCYCLKASAANLVLTWSRQVCYGLSSSVVIEASKLIRLGGSDGIGHVHLQARFHSSVQSILLRGGFVTKVGTCAYERTALYRLGALSHFTAQKYHFSRSRHH